jgi:hypothetical protein
MTTQAGRFYSSEYGRWLNRDPIGVAGGINTYNSVNNDMVNGFSGGLGFSGGMQLGVGKLGTWLKVDPWGLDFIEVDESTKSVYYVDDEGFNTKYFLGTYLKLEGAEWIHVRDILVKKSCGEVEREPVLVSLPKMRSQASGWWTDGISSEEDKVALLKRLEYTQVAKDNSLKELRKAEGLHSLKNEALRRNMESGATDFFDSVFSEVAMSAIAGSGLIYKLFKKGKRCPDLLDYTTELTKTGQEARTRLRSSLGLVTGSGLEAHHLIPWGLRNHKVVQLGAKKGFNMNGAMNGLGVLYDQHRGQNRYNHRKYNAAVKKILDMALAEKPNMTGCEAAQLLINYTDRLRKGIQNATGRLR